MDNLPNNENKIENEEFSTVFSDPTAHIEKKKVKNCKRSLKALSLLLIVAILICGTVGVIKFIPEKENKNNDNDEITVLAGANNSGKTSLITLIKNVFTKEKVEYSESDIPAVNMQNWINTVYPMFKNFFYDKKAVESIEKELVENIIPEDEGAHRITISTTELKIHVSYEPAVDDIKMFADYIMDLDETQHAFYFLYTYEVSRRKFVKGIIEEYNKIKHRFEEIEEDIKKEKHDFVMIYRIQDGQAIVDGMFHELQDYEGIFTNELHLD